MLAPLTLLVPVVLALAAAPAPDPGQSLRDAAREGDLGRVRALLDAGTPVDAPNPDGVTPLLYAAERGNLEIVRLLVERGADVNARDRFFRASALDLAIDSKQVEVAIFLLEHGADAAGDALDAAVEAGQADLARAALATGRVGRLDLLAARREAEGKASAEIRDMLAAAPLVSPPRAPFTLPADGLKKYEGRFRGAAGEIIVSQRDGAIVVSAAGRPEIVLRPVAPDRFEDAGGSASARFGGRGGMVEGLRLNVEGEVTGFGAVTGSEPAPLPTASIPETEAAPREAPRPWPSFRGEGARGIGDGQGAPWTWTISSGENVRFRTPIPGIALSSPIVWGGRIFVTTAVSAAGDATFRTGLYGDPSSVDDLSEHSFRVLALDAATGKILWEREVHRGRPGVKRHLKSSQANETPATDGKRVVALFGTVGLLVAFDLEGTPLWRTEVGVLDSGDPVYGTAEWGHASSPILHRDHVIVQADRRSDSFLAAYRIDTGEAAWRVARDEASTFATPNVLPGPGGDEIVTNGTTIRGYDAASGRLLWTLGPNSETIVATPVVGDGMAFVTGGYPPVRPIYAVRPGGRGDLSLPEGQRASAAIAWSHERGGTYLPTPILYRGFLYLVNNNGVLTCYRAATGEQVYQTRVAGSASFSASPVAADGRLYFPSETGEVYVLRAGPEFELLAASAMDEVVLATPAISDGLLVVRTLGHVVGIAAHPAASPPAAEAPAGSEH